MSRADAQFKLRLPAALRAQLEQSAGSARRSLNAELLIRLEASFAVVPAQVIADEPQSLPAPAARPSLYLCCLRGDAHYRTAPIVTLQPLPPRASVSGRWPLDSHPGLEMRPAYRREPSPELLARCLRLGQPHGLCAAAGA